MPGQQLELWSAEPHPTPPVYPQLTLQQRTQLVSHLTELMLKLVQTPPKLPTSLRTQNHER